MEGECQLNDAEGERGEQNADEHELDGGRAVVPSQSERGPRQERCPHGVRMR
jgi:hypothetical protein